MLISFFGTMKLKLTGLGGLSSSWEEPVQGTKNMMKNTILESKYYIIDTTNKINKY